MLATRMERFAFHRTATAPTLAPNALRRRAGATPINSKWLMCRSCRLRPGGEDHSCGVGDRDVDLEGRNHLSAFHAHLDVIPLDRDVLGDRGQDLLAQGGE